MGYTSGWGRSARRAFNSELDAIVVEVTLMGWLTTASIRDPWYPSEDHMESWRSQFFYKDAEKLKEIKRRYPKRAFRIELVGPRLKTEEFKFILDDANIYAIVKRQKKQSYEDNT